MNPVEIEEAVSNLALEPFDRAEFPFRFLAAFGNKDAAIQRLRSGNTNQSDLPGAVLQRSHIHIATCDPGKVDETLAALRASPKTTSQKVKLILATDGEAFQAEDLNGGGTVACTYQEFPDHFGFFLPLAGITTVEQIRESSFDIKATGRLNRLYLELLKDNPNWASRPRDMNHFMARLIFCFFAEDTDIFLGEGLFSRTIEQMSARLVGIVLHSGEGREILWQARPLAFRRGDALDRVPNRKHPPPTWAPDLRPHRDEGHDQQPFRIRAVACIAQ